MSIRKSLVITSIDRYLNLAVNIGSTVVLARLLTPNEVGAFSVAMAIISIMSMMRGMGATQYLVQEKDLTEDRIRAVWTVQLGIGLMLGLVIAGMAIPVAHIYKDERLRNILFLLALNFAVTPFGSITHAWLARELRFGSMAVIQFSNTAANATVSIGLAWSGWGAVSLAWGNLAAAVVSALVATFFRPSSLPWLPGFTEIRRVLSFGARISLAWLADTAAKSAPDFFLGALQNLTAAGYYSRASGLLSLFNRLVSDVAGAVVTSDFAKQSRESRDTRAPFVLALTYVCTLCWAFAGFICFMAGPVVRLLYGEQWAASTPLVGWLAGALAVGSPMYLCLAALTGLGAATSILRAGLLSAVTISCLALLGAFFSMQGVAVGILVANVFGSWYWLRAAQGVINFHWSDLKRAASISVLVALGATLGPALVWLLYSRAGGHHIAALALSSITAGAGFLVTVWWTAHPLRDELRRFLGTFASARLKRRGC